MSTHSIASLQRITREDLAPLVRERNPGLAIIDVRDSDFIGGHIMGCQHLPTGTHDYRMPELVRTLQDKETVVFHCALSQQRGPSSALRYLREKERLLGKDEGDKQKVYVLDLGFQGWQEKYVRIDASDCLDINSFCRYGEDQELTEGYVKDLWENY
jgi:Cdc25 family phosphatase